MKKHLIALAVAGAVAAPVMAQNVTVYGTMDFSIQSVDTTSNGSFTRNSAENFATSRLGFKGSEDLGGGLKANFTLQASGSDTVTPFASAAEEMWVGLSGAFGEIRIGTTDMSGLQAVDASVSPEHGNLALNPKIDSGSATQYSGEQGADTNNVVRYISPVINGFQVDAGYTSGNASTATSDGNAAATSLLVSYVNGPISLYAGQHEIDGVGVGKKDYRALGARYNAGMAAVGFYTSKGDASTTSNDADVQNSVINLSVPLGNGLTALAASMKSKIQDTAYKAKGYQFGLKKALSKRTTVYGAYTSVTADGAAYVSWGPNAVQGTAGDDTKTMTVGISHSF